MRICKFWYVPLEDSLLRKQWRSAGKFFIVNPLMIGGNKKVKHT